MAGILVKSLAKELRTGPTRMDPLAFPAGLLHWRDSAIALHLESIIIAVASGPEGNQQTRDQGLAGARKGCEQRGVRMRDYELLNTPLEFRDMIAQRCQQCYQTASRQGSCR